MNTRRQLLQIATAGATVLTAAEPKKSPKYFKKADLDLLATLADHIIPRSDTPGAADANVHYYIDWQAHTNPELGAKLKADVAWIRTQGFGKKSHDEQVKLLTQWSQSTGEPRNIFTRLKDLAIDGYYGTEAGLKTELGWNANTFLREYKGCTHPEHA